MDGCIANKEGGVGWPEPFEAVDYGYKRFISGIRTVVMGRKTCDQARGLGPDWVYAGKHGMVVASSPLADSPPDVAPWTDGIADLVRHLRKLDDGDVWIVGGSRLQPALLNLGAFDRLAGLQVKASPLTSEKRASVGGEDVVVCCAAYCLPYEVGGRPAC